MIVVSVLLKLITFKNSSLICHFFSLAKGRRNHFLFFFKDFMSWITKQKETRIILICISYVSTKIFQNNCWLMYAVKIWLLWWYVASYYYFLFVKFLSFAFFSCLLAIWLKDKNVGPYLVSLARSVTVLIFLKEKFQLLALLPTCYLCHEKLSLIVMFVYKYLNLPYNLFSVNLCTFKCSVP